MIGAARRVAGLVSKVEVQLEARGRDGADGLHLVDHVLERPARRRLVRITAKFSHGAAVELPRAPCET